MAVAVEDVRKAPAAAVATEDDLVARAQAGDSEAFNTLAERYSTRLRPVLYRITRDCDAAYDAVQEALLRAWQNIGRFEGRSRFYTWLTRIGINEAHHGLRTRQPETLDMEDGVGERVPDWGGLPDGVFASREFLAAVEGALGELPADYRVAVTPPSSATFAGARAAGACSATSIVRWRECGTWAM